MHAASPAITLALFSSREPLSQILDVLAAQRAAFVEPVRVDVMVNGPRTLADDLARHATDHQDKFDDLHVWHSPLADKAHAWNEHLHRVWDGRSWLFNMDGYVSLLPGMPDRLLTALKADATRLAATGTPTVGRSAAALRKVMLAEGGLHGNFFLLRPETASTLRQVGFRLPVGLYRTDATLGAILSFGMDPRNNAWAPRQHILVHPEVTWSTPDKRWWLPFEWRNSWKRMLRQAAGRIENRAVRHHFAVLREGPQTLPARVRPLIERWKADCPGEFRDLILRHPLAWSGYRRLATSAADASSPPSAVLVYRHGG